MIRVVLDTNVVVSALVNPNGLEASLLVLALRGKITQLCISEAVLAEYQLVLPRPKLKLDPERVREGLLDIRKASRLVRPSRTLSICSDPLDNRILECADAAGAQYLVTGNKRHFPKRWKNTEVVNARELVEIVGEKTKE